MVPLLISFFIVVGIIRLVNLKFFPVDQRVVDEAREEYLPQRKTLDITVLIILLLFSIVVMMLVDDPRYSFLFFLFMALTYGYIGFRDWKWSKRSGEYKRYFLLVLTCVIYTCLAFMLFR